MTEQTTEKTFKLPAQVREYHKIKEREKQARLGHPWLCSHCGSVPTKDEPLYKNMDTKQKLCDACTAKELVQRKKKQKEVVINGEEMS